jgi:DNA-binding response OmpR family regulator
MTVPPVYCATADPAVKAFVRASLKGSCVTVCRSAAELLKAWKGPGLAVIDSSLPDMGGRDLVAVLRGAPRTARSTLVLLGRGPHSPAAAAACFDNGADEYFTLPADPRLFRARLLNLLARGGACAAPQKPAEYAFGALRVSPEARTASIKGAPLRLTALEFDLLMYFLRNQGRVVSRSVLLEQVWRLDRTASARAVDKRIEALRAGLGRSYGAKIRTVFGLGYIFKL